MAAVRYWRVVGLDTFGGGDLELSALHLYDGTGRVDGTATISSVSTPIAGALANLQDTDTSTICRFAEGAVRASNFSLVWDFGVGVAVDIVAFAVGTASAKALSPRAAVLQGSADGIAWTTVYNGAQIPFPAANTMTAALTTPSPWDPAVKASPATLSNSNFTVALTIAGGQSQTAALGRLTGKWYFELLYNGGLADTTPVVGLTTAQYTTYQPGPGTAQERVYGRGGSTFFTGDSQFRAFGSAWANGSIIGVAVDLDAKKIWFSLDGTWQASGDPAAGTTPALTLVGTIFYPLFAANNGSSGTGTLKPSFASQTYAPPAGFAPWDGSSSVVTGYFDLPSNATPRPAPGALRLTTNVPAAAATPQLHFGKVYDTNNSGRGRVHGTVKEKATPSNLPLKRRVRLFEERSGLFIREAWSDPLTGDYDFRDLNPGIRYTVASYDFTHSYRAVIADNITPEIQP